MHCPEARPCSATPNGVVDIAAAGTAISLLSGSAAPVPTLDSLCSVAAPADRGLCLGWAHRAALTIMLDSFSIIALALTSVLQSKDYSS